MIKKNKVGSSFQIYNSNYTIKIEANNQNRKCRNRRFRIKQDDFILGHIRLEISVENPSVNGLKLRRIT